MLGREVRRKMTVFGRIPKRIIHAIQNAVQIGRALMKYAVELLAKLRRLNLLGILLAHRRQLVAEHHTTLEKIEVVILLQLVHGEDVPGKEQFLCSLRRICALVCGVVNREYGRRTEQIRVGLVDRAQINGNQRRLPIVNMKNVGHAELF